MSAENDSPYSEYIGREERTSDAMAPERAAELAALLGRQEAGGPMADLPAVWHWVYFHHAFGPGDLGPDGHLKRGTSSVIPPIPATKRMYAGGKVKVLAPLALGLPAEKVSVCTSVEQKSGRSGDLVFVTIEHSISQGGTLARVEEQSLVFFDPPPATYRPFTMPALDGDAGSFEHSEAIGSQTREGLVRQGTLRACSPMLFAYSALTGNPHKIHYDRTYCQGVEGYPGLVVHGPLLATAALEVAMGAGLGRVSTFEFRARSPIFEGQLGEVRARRDGPSEVAIEITCEGDLCMTAKAGFEV